MYMPQFPPTPGKEGFVHSLRRERPVLASLTAGSRPASDALFDRFVGDGDYFSPVWAGLPVAVWEDHDHVYLEADLPGVDEQDVDVSVEDDKVLIRGERNPAGCRSYLFDGRSYGRFERVITLPEPVDTGQVEAWLNRGVLSIVLRKGSKVPVDPQDHRSHVPTECTSARICPSMAFQRPALSSPCP
jgi:HSP20 family protein